MTTTLGSGRLGLGTFGAAVRPPVPEPDPFAGLPFGQLVQPYVELGIGLNSQAGKVAQWDEAHWDNPDSGVWSGQEPDWVGVPSCDLYGVSIVRGRDRWLDRFPAGTASVELNDEDGHLSWDAGTTGPELVVRPGRQLRVFALLVPTGEIFQLWRGYLESVTSTMAPDLTPLAQLNGQDVIAQLGHIDMPEGPVVGTGEPSDARVHRILDLADWPASWRNIDPGQVTLQGTNFARPLSDELGITADSEGGAAYATPDGNLRFRNRTWLTTAPESTEVQATIGGDPGDLCAAEYQTTRDASDIVNHVSVGRAGGTALTFVNTISISRFRTRTYSRTDFISEHDTDVAVIGQRILNSRAYAQARLPSLTLRPLTEEEFRFVLSVDFGWLLEVRYDPAHGRMTGGAPWSRLMHVQGINHTFGPGGWETVLRVDDSYANPLSAWDSAQWDRDTWSDSV